MIELKNVNKTYQDNKQIKTVLEDINLNIKDDIIFGIIGISGAGKTTITKLITGLESPTSGNIYFDGLDINTLKTKAKRKFYQQLGIVFQGYHLLNQVNVYKNVAFPLEIAKQDKMTINNKVMNLLKEVGLTEKVNSFPSSLSGGQKQRVAIARALANNPKFLILDEPTAALDPLTTFQLLKLLKEIKNNYHITIIIITHDMRIIKTLCDEVVVIDEGKIIEYGEIKTIVEHPKNELTKLLIAGDMNV